MQTEAPKQLLKDPEQTPSADLFKAIMSAQLYQTFEEQQAILAELGLATEWRFYKDGKAWLCKVTRKKKTIVWISLWEGLIKSGFYFTENTSPGLLELAIDENIKSTFLAQKPIGKLIPVILDIQEADQLADFKKIAAYKSSLK